ncbi:MAG: CRISPR-associated endoribonuclease Cas6 [Maribacter sp.]|jgi:CRISPR-associated endoribonuclease Cas6
MRLRLNLTCKKGSILKKDYKPQLFAAVYKMINDGNSEYSQWLHDSGYKDGHKSLKFFTYSDINIIPPFSNDNKNSEFRLNSGKAELVITMLAKEALESIVKGAFKEQTITLRGYGNDIQFNVNGVEMLPTPHFKNVAEFKTISPICINLQNKENEKGKHLHPLMDPEYNDLFIRNLRTNYTTAQKLGLISTTKQFREEDIRLEILSEPKRITVLTKRQPGKKDIKYKCYNFSFRLHAPAEIIRVGYDVGFGVQTGLGCVEVI